MLFQEIECNYCFNADRRKDYYLATVRCNIGEVCFVDSGVITYADKTKKVHQLPSFEMGCYYGYLCADGVRYGPGPFGYTRIERQCCCSDRCVQADGVGKGVIHNCVHAQFNESTISAGSYVTASFSLWSTSVSFAILPWIIYQISAMFLC